MSLANPDLMASIAVTRFGLGARPGELAAARADPKVWLKSQIISSGADQPGGDLAGTAERIVADREYRQERRAMRQEDGRRPPRGQRPGPPMQQANPGVVLQQEMVARAKLSASTAAPFRERWALFWANHFTVSATKARVVAAVGPFEREAIRPHVFGDFATLLRASSRHPAMLIYLDQVQSVGPNSRAAARRPQGAGLNENLAREILELHTVGVDGGYTQDDVTEFARALTGWTVGRPNDLDEAGTFVFAPNTHEPGPRTVMGRTYGDEGERTALRILDDLADHPATARHLARKAAIHFVADDPPAALVAKLESAFKRSGGRLDAMANALIDADESWAPAPAKFKTPYELIISAHRALGVAPLRPPQVAQPLATLGQPPFRPPSPEGWPDEGAAWAAPDALLKRLAWSETFASQVSDGPRPPLQVAIDCLGPRLTTETNRAIANAESRTEALTILFMSPEFQRR